MSAGLPGVLKQYRRDRGAADYLRLLRAATEPGVPDSKAGRARLLGCGPEHAETVTTNLVRHGLVELVYHQAQREWFYRATGAGVALLAELPNTPPAPVETREGGRDA